MSLLDVSAIPAFTDNYIWLLRTGGTACAVVDPGDAGPVRRVLDREGLDLRYILLTHHHPDHVGGAEALSANNGVKVFAPRDSRIQCVHEAVGEGDRAVLPELGLSFKVLEVPGHTRTHIAFTGHGALFCGDTLFSVGCGRLFEGTPEQMQVSLDKLASLPEDTRVYCGHEYTEANCRFALEVEPGNVQLRKKLATVSALRAAGKITLPGILGEEQAVNPFLRSRESSVVEAAQVHDPSALPGHSTLGVIRRWKDRW